MQQIVNKQNQYLSNKLLRLDRSKLRKVVGLITGHNSLHRPHSFIGRTDSPLCKGRIEAEHLPSDAGVHGRYRATRDLPEIPSHFPGSPHEPGRHARLLESAWMAGVASNSGQF
ncbi:jg16537 [Pararge aegeria aegeria]|uniref:Jg16537 protein n=1 Tax=Pararge aegeria aegeria TaxID=348720 RepID=A0A8S4SPE6_9NEOP|nr:jg16537 [Pararge aegeria aegeria]